MIILNSKQKEDYSWQNEADQAYKILNTLDFTDVNVDDKKVEIIKDFIYRTAPFFYINETEIPHILNAKVIIDLEIVRTSEDNVILWLTNCIKKIMSHVDSPEHQIFSVIASRLLIIQMYFEYCLVHNVKTPYDSVHRHIDFCVKSSLYKEDLSQYDFISEVVFSRDLLFDYTSLKHFKKSYINTVNDYCCELPQHVYMCVSALFADKQCDKRNSCLSFYNSVSLKKLSLATPILANLRTKRHSNLASCFIIKVDDSIQNMFYNLFSIAQISKNGGGIGVNLSKLRSEGAVVGDRANAACGVIHFAKVINDTGLTVNQGGRRSAAITVSLDVWHRDILTFLEMQTESGDVRKKAFDIFPQIVVNDTFMKFVEEGKEWVLFDPEEVRRYNGIKLDELNGEEFEKQYHILLEALNDESANLRIIKVAAIEIMKKIMKAQIETGLPYVFFKDTANRFNANKHDGQIVCGNLCQESFSNVKESIVTQVGNTITATNGYAHTCNLLSLNLANILDFSQLESAVRQAVRILDTSIDICDPSIQESRDHNSRYRTIGIGSLGLHDHLAYMRIKYSEAQAYVDNLFEHVLFYALSESNKIAQEKEAYPAFQNSEWSKGVILQKNRKDLEASNLNWNLLIDNIQKYGIRNGHLLAIAPNTSSSIIQNASSSVLPIHKNFFFDNNSRGIAPIFALYYNSRKEYYEEYANIPINKVVDVISNIQKWVDQGISFELLFDLNKNKKASDIFNAIMYIWKKNCKTIYYVRTLQKRVQKEIKEVKCDSCTL